MKFAVLLAVSLSATTAAFAADEYNSVPRGNAQYAQCLVDAATKYQGGESASPVSGQTKAQAWCTCLWNETPDDFKDNLSTFADGARGTKTNMTCRQYANWQTPRPTELAQSLGELDRREAAVVEAWQKTPLTPRQAFFVSEPASGFGVYKRRPNVFKPGEGIHVYVEPVGYRWKDVDNGMFEFGFSVDMLIKTADGKIIVGREGFGHFAVQSHAHNREFMLNLNLNLTGVAPGEYAVEYRLHDSVNGQVATFSLPFTIAN